MLKQAERFRRITTNDPSQPNFVPRQVSEFEFKESYVKEAIRLGKRNHDIGVDDMRKLLLGSYAIEGSGAITYDTQSGTKLKFTAPDQTGTNEAERRNLKNPASTAIGYTQLLVSTDLHVIHDDNGAIVARLREIGKDTKDTARAEEIEDKAKLFEILQSKLDDELKQFAKKDKTSMAAYLDSRGNLDVKSEKSTPILPSLQCRPHSACPASNSQAGYTRYFLTEMLDRSCKHANLMKTLITI